MSKVLQVTDVEITINGERLVPSAEPDDIVIVNSEGVEALAAHWAATVMMRWTREHYVAGQFWLAGFFEQTLPEMRARRGAHWGPTVAHARPTKWVCSSCTREKGRCECGAPFVAWPADQVP